MNISTPWLKSSKFDLTFIVLPPFFSILFVLFFSDLQSSDNSIPLWAWFVFVLGIDVSHVYSTLFRTYFNSNEFTENKTLFTLIPIGVWVTGVVLYTMSGPLFWRALAYVAVFHFIRQQYGFIRLYTRSDILSTRDHWLSNLLVYLATAYPIIYWHCHQPRNFHWFMDGDFLPGLPLLLSKLVGSAYLIVIFVYLVNEVGRLSRGLPLNIPKNAIIIGTALSWYVGIVYFNDDMAFTVTNVVSHGIPYMALVWIYGVNQKDRVNSPLIFGRFPYQVFFSKFSLPLFFAVLFLFGYLEEGLWAGLVWREHLEVFGVFSWLPKVSSKDTLAWLVPLLTLPQATHYVIDGFIWKMKTSDANWQRILFLNRRVENEE